MKKIILFLFLLSILTFNWVCSESSIAKEEKVKQKRPTYYEYYGNGHERLKIRVPDEWAEQIYSFNLDPKEDQDQIMEIIFENIISDDNYGKVVSQSIGEFLSEYYVTRDLFMGGYPIFDQIEIGDLVVVVVGDTSREEPETYMFAYRKK